jgi:hypothetical protein
MQGGGNQTGPPTKRGLDCLSSEREPSSRQVCHYRGLQSGRTGRHTIVLPAVLLLVHSPLLFGYAKREFSCSSLVPA